MLIYATVYYLLPYAYVKLRRYFYCCFGQDEIICRLRPTPNCAGIFCWSKAQFITCCLTPTLNCAGISSAALGEPLFRYLRPTLNCAGTIFCWFRAQFIACRLKPTLNCAGIVPADLGIICCSLPEVYAILRGFAFCWCGYDLLFNAVVHCSVRRVTSLRSFICVVVHVAAAANTGHYLVALWLLQESSDI